LWKKQIPTNIFFIELIFNVGCTLYFGHLEPSNNDVVEYTNCINKNAKHNFDLLATIKTSMNELNPHGWIIMESSSSSSSSSLLLWTLIEGEGGGGGGGGFSVKSPCWNLNQHYYLIICAWSKGLGFRGLT
jgi:hypothetical protein